jgi:hypothetical protein
LKLFLILIITEFRNELRLNILSYGRTEKAEKRNPDVEILQAEDCSKMERYFFIIYEANDTT